MKARAGATTSMIGRIGPVASVPLALIVAWQAIQRIRADHRRRDPHQLAEAFVALAGVAVAPGSDRRHVRRADGASSALAGLLFIVVFAAGLTALIVAVNRRAPVGGR